MQRHECWHCRTHAELARFVITRSQNAAAVAKAEELAKASQKLGEIMYAQAQAEAQKAAGGAEGGAEGGGAAGGKAAEKVVDAEFTEVKDRKA